MISSYALALVLAMPMASGLSIKEEPKTTRPGGNAFVIMWVANKHIPADVKLMQKEQVLSGMELKTVLTAVDKVVTQTHPELKENAKLRKLYRSAEGMDSKWIDAAKGAKVALKHSLQLQAVGSKYPLVVLTNDPHLIEIKTNKTLQAQYPNVVIREIQKHEWLKHECKMAAGHSTHFQKLSIFGLTEYDKMIWLDMDVLVKKNMDTVFDEYDLQDGNKVWGQRDDWDCHNNKEQFCSGMMLFKPKQDHVKGLMAQAKTQAFCWGDQKLIAKYFSGAATKGAPASPRSKGLFPHNVINWGQCGTKNSFAAHIQDGGGNTLNKK